MEKEEILTFEEYREKYKDFYINLINNAKKTFNTEKVFLDGKEMDLESYLKHGYENKLKAIEFRNENKKFSKD